MAPPRRSASKPKRRRRRNRSLLGWWLLLALVVAGAWVYTQRRAAWDRAVSVFHPAHRPTPSAPVVPVTAQHQAPASPCGPPLPELEGGAMAQAKLATFTTVEHVLSLPPSSAPGVYRIQARLVQYDLGPADEYRLRLISLVNRNLELNAVIPAPACTANQDDAALYDELREDIGLRFGVPAARPIQLRLPADVMITGVAHFGRGRVELQPVLDFRVQ